MHNKSLTGKRIADIIVIIAIVIIPLMYGALLTSAYESPIERMSNIKAAIINDDSPADIRLVTGETKRFALGDELVEALTDPNGEDVGFTWEEMTLEEAQRQISNEEIRAYLHIPSGFTEAVTQFATADAGRSRQQLLELRTDDGINYLAGTLSRTVALALQERLTQMSADQYIDNVLVGMGKISNGMNEAADGADQLSSGAGAMTTGLGTLADGTQTAANGSTLLVAGARQLADGISQASSGSGELSKGAVTLRDGAHTLNDGVSRYIDAVGQARNGATTLSQGVELYTNGVSQAADGASRISAGAGALAQLSEGITSYTSAVDMLRSQVNGDGSANTLVGGVATLSSAIGAPTAQGNLADPQSNVSLVQGANALHQGTTQLAGRLNDPATQGALTALNTGTQTLATGIEEYTAAVAQAQTLCAAGQTAQCQAVLDGLVARNTALNAGAQQLTAGTAAAQAQFTELTQGVNALDQAAGKLEDGMRKIAAGAQQLQGKVGAHTDIPNPQTGEGMTVAGALNALSSQSPGLRDGGKSATGLIDATGQLSEGLSTLASQNGRVSAGSQQLADGLTTLDSKSPALTSGASQLADGSTRLAAGVDTLRGGLGQLSEGSTTLAGKSSELADGLSKLAEGSNQARSGSAKLADGAQQLKNGLEEGAEQIPTFKAGDTTHIASVVSSPVRVEAERSNPVAHNGAGFTPMFMSLSLWIGAIAMFLVMPALDRRGSSAERWWMSAFKPAIRGTILGVTQAVVLVLGTNWLVGLNTANLPLLLFVAVAASLTFVAVNQMLLVALAYRGRFVSILLLCLQITSMGATFPIETSPAFFQWIHPLLPMSYTQLAMRSAIAGQGADGAVVEMLLMLALWFAVAVLLIMFAAYKRRGLDPLPHDNALLRDALAEEAQAQEELDAMSKEAAQARWDE